MTRREAWRIAESKLLDAVADLLDRGDTMLREHGATETEIEEMRALSERMLLERIPDALMEVRCNVGYDE